MLLKTQGYHLCCQHPGLVAHHVPATSPPRLGDSPGLQGSGMRNPYSEGILSLSEDIVWPPSTVALTVFTLPLDPLSIGTTSDDPLSQMSSMVNGPFMHSCIFRALGTNQGHGLYVLQNRPSSNLSKRSATQSPPWLLSLCGSHICL